MVRDASTATWTARASRNGSGQTPLLDLILLREDEGPTSNSPPPPLPPPSPPSVEEDEDEVDMFRWSTSKVPRRKSQRF